jgi:hypothetical protein
MRKELQFTATDERLKLIRTLGHHLEDVIASLDRIGQRLMVEPPCPLGTSDLIAELIEAVEFAVAAINPKSSLLITRPKKAEKMTPR